METTDRDARPAILGWSILVGVGTVLLTRLARGVPNLFFEDDAYFYLRIAWNIATGRGSTFDGLHATNGYHLLWTGVLVPLAALTASLGFGQTTFLASVCGLALAIAVTSVVTTFRSSAERALALLIFLFCGLTMETVLLGPLLLLVVRLFLGTLALPGPIIAIISALIPLTRIDFLWAAPALACLAAGTAARRRAIPVVPVLVGTAVGVALHFGCEQAFFGTWASVSSAYKADAARDGGLTFLLRNLQGLGNQLRYIVAVSLTALALTGWARTRDWRELAAVGVGLLPLVAYSFLVEMRDWYFLTALLLTLALASAAWRDRPAVMQIGAVCLTALLATACVAYLALSASDRARTSRFIIAANDVLTPNDVIYQVDGSGFTGWWLKAHVVDGDGVVNSWDYRRRVLREDLAGYLADIGATHVVTDTTVVNDPLISSQHGMIVWRRDAQLVLDTEPTRNPLVRFRLFALTPPRPRREVP